MVRPEVTGRFRVAAMLAALVAAVDVPGAQGQHATLNQCSRSVGADSVTLFFNARYELTPAGCAVIRRQVRLTAEGQQYGRVEDFRVSSNRLLVSARYDAGRLHGPYAAFHANGQPAVRGQYEHGQRRGDWEYWYASGRPRQLVRFLADGSPRIITCWDTTGREVVTNGNGTWEGTASYGFRSSGRIRLGLPDGTWQGYTTQGTQQFTAVEQYEQNQFRQGYWTDSRQHRQAYTSGMLAPLMMSAVDQATPLRLGLTCDEQTRRQQFALLKEHLRVPTVSLGAQRYGERLTQRMLRYCDAGWYRALPAKVKVRCSLDSTGQFTAFQSEVPAWRQMMQHVLTRTMPRWQPARFQGVPVPGYVDVELDTTTHVITVRPAARLQPEQLPLLPTADLL